MSADLLLRAAEAKEAWADRIEALMRKTSPAPWVAEGGRVWTDGLDYDRVVVDTGFISTSGEPVPDAAYVASMNPAEGARLVAEARTLAAWLRAEATDAQWRRRGYMVEALAVARAILGEAS